MVAAGNKDAKARQRAHTGLTSLADSTCACLCTRVLQALAQTSTTAGSSFSLTASAAAANVTNALGLLLQHKLSLRCEAGGADPGALCYDGAFKMITTARALNVRDPGSDVTAYAWHTE